jgi:hypothetical protein
MQNSDLMHLTGIAEKDSLQEAEKKKYWWLFYMMGATGHTSKACVEVIVSWLLRPPDRLFVYSDWIGMSTFPLHRMLLH